MRGIVSKTSVLGYPSRKQVHFNNASKIYGNGTYKTVMSRGEDGVVAPTPIISKYMVGRPDTKEDLIFIKTESLYPGSQYATILLGKDTPILSEYGMIPASDVEEGEYLISYYSSHLNGAYRKLFWALISGKSTLITRGEKASLCISNHRNKRYLQWKLDQIGRYTTFSNTNAKGEHRSEYLISFEQEKRLHKDWHNPATMINHFCSDIGLALLFGDHGYVDDSGTLILDLSNRYRHYPNEIDKICRAINKQLALAAFSNTPGQVKLSRVSTDLFLKRIAPVSPEAIWGKFPDQYRPIDKPVHKLYADKISMKKIEVEVIEKRSASPSQFRKCGPLFGFSSYDQNILAGSPGGFFCVVP
jgi:hypothetical protein